MEKKKTGRKNSVSEKTISKAKPITLLSIICSFMAFLLILTFLRFPMGIKDFNSVLGAINLDYDLEGGTAYTLELASDNIEEVDDINGVLSTLRNRLNELGYQSYSVKALKSTEEGVEDYAIRIEVESSTPGVDKSEVESKVDNDIRAVAAYGELTIIGGTSNSDANPEILTEQKAVANAKYSGTYEDTYGETKYLVTITFTDYGYNSIIELINESASSESSTGFYMGFKLGETTLLPQSEIKATSFSGKSLVIESTTLSAAKQMALQIKTGGLAYKYDVEKAIEDKVDVTSPYGKNVAVKCVVAIALLVVLFIVAYALLYKGYAIVAGLSLLAFILLETLMMIAVPGIILSIGGVVGIAFSTVLTAICLALTANAIKSELAKTEKTVKAGVKSGYKASVIAIVNIFVTLGIASLCLFFFNIGVLKSFATTFGIGCVVGIISALVFAKMFASLVMPIANYSEKFLGIKRVEE